MIEPEPTSYLHRPYSLLYRLARAFTELLVSREVHFHHIQSAVSLVVNVFSRLTG